MMIDWTLAALLLGVTFGFGLLVLVLGIRGTDQDYAPRRRGRQLLGAMAPTGRSFTRSGAQRGRGPLLAVIAAAAVWVITGWPALAFAAAVAVLLLPAFIGSGRRDKRRIERYEALADWIRRLASRFDAGGGITTTLVRSADQVQPAIGRPVRALATRISARMRPDEALRAFAEDMADPASDLIACALIQISTLQGAGSVRVLQELADTMSREVIAARAIDTERSAPRLTMRIVIAVSVGTAVAMGIFTDYLAPYGSTTGQIALVVIMSMAGLCMMWLWLKTNPRPAPRFMTDDVPSRWQT